MKRTRFLIPILLANFLYGCNSDIDAIKNGRLDAYPEYTIGQAFDNRDMCESTDWESIKDERGRTIIRYTCHMEGVKEGYLEEATTLISEAKNKDTQNKYQSDIKSWKVKIPETKIKIKEEEEKIKKELTLESSINPIDEKISCLSKYIRDTEKSISLSSNRVYLDKNPCIQDDKWEPQEIRIPRANSIIGYYKNKKLPELIKEREEAINYFPTRLRHTISGKTRELETSINVMNSNIEFNQKKIDEENQSDDLKMKRGTFLRDNHKTADAFETVDWLLLEDGTIMIVNSALHKRSPGENDYEISPHRKIKYVLISAYQNNPKNFFDYEPAIRRQGLIDAFR